MFAARVLWCLSELLHLVSHVHFAPVSQFEETDVALARVEDHHASRLAPGDHSSLARMTNRVDCAHGQLDEVG